MSAFPSIASSGIPLTIGIYRNPVLAAYTASLESQISSLRDEIATAYKSQTQNTQRLLSMTETLREKEEGSRVSEESLRKARDDVATLKRKVDQHNELMSEKDRTVQASLVHCYPSHCINSSLST